jgi:ceramide glucosyltransferase
MSGTLLAGLAVWLAAGVVYRFLALRALGRMCEAAGAEPAAPCPGEHVVLRPLHGAGQGTERCLESLLAAAGRAGARVVLGAEDPADPAVAIAERALARHPEVRAELRVAPGPEARNRKVANLIRMAAGVKGDAVLVTDADVCVPPDYVARATRPLEDPAVGLVTGPYRSVPAPGVASRLDALVTNTHFVPSACFAARFEGLHFALGASIAVRGEALARAGGFEALRDRAADDYWLARNVERAGYALAWSPVLVDHVLERRGFRAAWRRHLRWARAVRSSRPVGYVGQLAVLGPLPALLLSLAWSVAGGPGWLAAVSYWSLQLAELWRLRELLGLRPRDLAWLPVADLLAVAIWAGGLAGRPAPPES